MYRILTGLCCAVWCAVIAVETFGLNKRQEMALDSFEMASCFNDEFTDDVTAQIRLVYDRESANGACDEVVCYEEHYDASGNRLDNTSILNFYAVTKDTMEVIPADKTSWAERGSQAYCEATGE